MIGQTEEWKIYKQWKNQYVLKFEVKISNYGNIEIVSSSIPFDKIITLNNGRRYCGSMPIYRLVDRLFRGELPKGYAVHHKDFNKLNDRLDNLERMTHHEHMIIHGLGKTKTEEQIEKQRQKMIGRTAWNKGKKCPQKPHGPMSDSHKESLSKAHTGKHWFNNGTKEIFCYECPDDFRKGRLKRNSDY